MYIIYVHQSVSIYHVTHRHICDILDIYVYLLICVHLSVSIYHVTHRHICDILDIHVYLLIYVHLSVSIYHVTYMSMGWLRLVGSLQLQFSFAKEPYKRETPVCFTNTHVYVT